MRRLGILIFMAILLGGATCERTLEIEFPEVEAQLVVISNFSDNQNLQVQVSLSRDVLETPAIEYLGNADVKVFEGDQLLETLGLVIPPSGTPFYTSKRFTPVVGTTYTIQVLVPGFDPVMAQSTIPERIEIHELNVVNLEVQQIPESAHDVYSFDLEINFKDPGDQMNFYHLKLYQQFEQFTLLRGDTIVSATPTRELRFNPANNDNFQVAHYEGGVLLEDTPFNGEIKTYTVPIEVEISPESELPGKIIAELRTVSEEYFLFYSTVSRQVNAQELNYTEPVIIFNNIDNGRGIFAGFSSSNRSIPIYNP